MKTYWYLTRGTGIVALLLLTCSVVLGVVLSVRGRTTRWPRFAVNALHRNLTLAAVAFVAVHVVTTVLDRYAPIRLVDAVVPFISAYRPIWLGLGAVAFDLLLALVVTSLLRTRIGHRLWRSLHWLAYASWPVALVHALGTGSDARMGFMLAAGEASLAIVALAVLGRVALAPGSTAARVAAAAAALVVPTAVVAWYEQGPGERGWARRAGTPAALLRRHLVVARAGPAPRQDMSAFVARLRGRISESQGPGGLVTVVIAGTLDRGRAGAVRIDLRGEPLQGGVAMTASGVSFVPGGTRTVYRGSVTQLDGRRVVAEVSAAGQTRLALGFDLNIDPTAGTVTGTVNGSPTT
jgi:Ferric reductase like transmembrane component